jgi:hypothetical protein
LTAPFHIIIKSKKQLLFSFLNLRAIVNGREIYPLNAIEPVIIPVIQNNPRLVITDGYHITKPLKLVYKEIPIYCFMVDCAITDLQLIIGFIIIIGFFVSGLITGVLILQVFSFLPLIYFIFFYYLNRKEFIRLVPVVN